MNFNIEGRGGTEKVKLVISTDNISFESTNFTLSQDSKSIGSYQENKSYQEVVEMLRKIDQAKRHHIEKQII